MSWIGVYAYFGETFPDGAGQEVYRHLLSERDRTPPQRLEHVLDELTRQLLTDEVAA